MKVYCDKHAMDYEEWQTEIARYKIALNKLRMAKIGILIGLLLSFLVWSNKVSVSKASPTILEETNDESLNDLEMALTLKL